MELTREQILEHREDWLDALDDDFHARSTIDFHIALCDLALLGLESRATPSAGDGVREAAEEALKLARIWIQTNVMGSPGFIMGAAIQRILEPALATPSATEAKGSEDCRGCKSLEEPAWLGHPHTCQPKAPTEAADHGKPTAQEGM